MRIAKARAQLGLGKLAEAAVTMAGIPTSYTYNDAFAITSGDNTLASRVTVGERIKDA